MKAKSGYKYSRSAEWGRKSRKYDDQMGKGKKEVYQIFKEQEVWFYETLENNLACCVDCVSIFLSGAWCSGNISGCELEV